MVHSAKHSVAPIAGGQKCNYLERPHFCTSPARFLYSIRNSAQPQFLAAGLFVLSQSQDWADILKVKEAGNSLTKSNRAHDEQRRNDCITSTRGLSVDTIQPIEAGSIWIFTPSSPVFAAMQTPTSRPSPKGGNNFLRLKPTISEKQTESPATHPQAVKRPFGGAETPDEPLTKHARPSQNGKPSNSKGKEPAQSTDTPPEKLLQFSKYMSTLTPPATGKGKGKAIDPTPSPRPADYLEPSQLQELFESDLQRHQAQSRMSRSPPKPAVEQPSRSPTPSLLQKGRETLHTPQNHNRVNRDRAPGDPIILPGSPRFACELTKRDHVFDAQNSYSGHRPSSSMATRSVTPNTHDLGARDVDVEDGDYDLTARDRLRDEVARMRNAYSDTYPGTRSGLRMAERETRELDDEDRVSEPCSDSCDLVGLRSPWRSSCLRARARASEVDGGERSAERRQRQRFESIEAPAQARVTRPSNIPLLDYWPRENGDESSFDRGGFELLGRGRRDDRRADGDVRRRPTSPTPRDPRHSQERRRERSTQADRTDASSPPQRPLQQTTQAALPPQSSNPRSQPQPQPQPQQQSPPHPTYQELPPSPQYAPPSPHITSTSLQSYLHAHVHNNECERFTPEQHIVLYDLSISLCEQRQKIAELKLERARVVFGIENGDEDRERRVDGKGGVGQKRREREV